MAQFSLPSDSLVKSISMAEKLLTRRELADALRISLDGLDALVHHPTRPLPRYQAGRKFLFNLAEVLKHLSVQHPSQKRVYR